MGTRNTNNTSADETRKSLSWLSGDRKLIVIFAVFDLILIMLAHRHFQNIRKLSTQGAPPAVALSEDNTNHIQELEKLAEKGYWDEFESKRHERSNYFLDHDLLPPRDQALYFYPETLPQSSFEREFAKHEIGAALEQLKRASIQKNKKSVKDAFAQLRARVLSYELGAQRSENKLSQEAKKFLRIYSYLARI